MVTGGLVFASPPGGGVTGGLLSVSVPTGRIMLLGGVLPFRALLPLLTGGLPSPPLTLPPL